MIRNTTRVVSVAIAFTVLLSALALPVGASGLALAQDGGNDATATATTTETTTTTATTTTATTSSTTAETTTTATPTTAETTTTAACEPGSSEPKLSQSRLYAAQKTVEPGSPGRIAGGFQVDPTAQCPVVVHITMSVPSGMSIEGSSDIASAGAGMVTAKFTVRPGANVKDIAANVYSQNTGQRTVTADIQYWPEGHQEMAREIDGLRFTYDVKEPATPTQTGSEDGEGLQISTPGFGVIATLGALVCAFALLRRE
ncbi:PGF-CTERM sorting domain-containing protein [Halorussus marinus]|uniref:PGF-CTERM sorting domain-containing protein n=1 Tax=Halorussus marinus TaxID=2505976 RepID=UPI00143E0B48|nr:PGF-CTERM sorting domain-containing protein [Halorussus marinus]